MIIGVLILAGFGAGVSSFAAPRVVATTTIVGDVVDRIGGGAIDLTVLFPRDVDPHTFEAVPRDVAVLAAADLVFVNGAGLEQAIAPLLDQTVGRIVDLSDGLPLIAADADAHDDDPDEHGHGVDVDPHVWFDPLLVARWLDAIVMALSEAAPTEAEAFRGRADAYRTRLEELDAWIRAAVEGVPIERRRLVTDHASLGYFAARYGFEQIGAVFPGFSTLAEPSARELAVLEDAVIASGAGVIFVGATVAPSLIERVARDTGIRIVFLYTGALGEIGGEAGTYLDMMRFDVEAIVAALSPEGAG